MAFPAPLDGTGAVPHHQGGGHPLGQRPRGAGHRADVDTVTDQELQAPLAHQLAGRLDRDRADPLYLAELAPLDRAAAQRLGVHDHHHVGPGPAPTPA